MAKAKIEKDEIKKDEEKDQGETKVDENVTVTGGTQEIKTETVTTIDENTKQGTEKAENKVEAVKEKVVYIGPNIKGILSNTVFEYMPNLDNYSDYPKLEKLFVKLEDLKKSQIQLKEKSNYLHLIYDQVKETESEKRKETK